MLNGTGAPENADKTGGLRGQIDELRSLIPRRDVVLFPKGKIAYPASIHVAGVDRQSDSRYDNDGMRRGPRSFALIQHTLSGTGRLRYGKRTYTLSAGKTMLLTVPHNHRYWLPRGGNWTFFWLCLHGHEALRIVRHAIDLVGPVITLDEATLELAVATVLEVMRGRVDNPTKSSVLAYNIVMHILGLTEPKPVGQAHERSAPIEHAIGYCRAHLNHPIGVADLARASGYSRYHFVRLFRESEGISPSEFIRNERLSAAAQLLVETERPIGEIAEDTGFTNANYLAKLFRRTYGMPPSAFRQRE